MADDGVGSQMPALSVGFQPTTLYTRYTIRKSTEWPPLLCNSNKIEYNRGSSPRFGRKERHPYRR